MSEYFIESPIAHLILNIFLFFILCGNSIEAYEIKNMNKTIFWMTIIFCLTALI